MKKMVCVLLIALFFPVVSWADFFGSKISIVNPTNSPTFFELKASNGFFDGCGVFSFGVFSDTNADVLKRNFSVALAAFAAQSDVIFITDENDRCKIIAFWIQQ